MFMQNCLVHHLVVQSYIVHYQRVCWYRTTLRTIMVHTNGAQHRLAVHDVVLYHLVVHNVALTYPNGVTHRTDSITMTT